MNNWLIIGFVLLVIVVVLGRVLIDWLDGKFRKLEYKYRKRLCIMTESERKCFVTLQQAVGEKYYVFPQIHLPSLLDHKIVGQNWNGAFRHIDEKSVDFVLCDKEKVCPILVIELDDRSHERPDRQERDREIERIFKGANVSLLRLKNNNLDQKELYKEISAFLSSNLRI